MLFSDQVSILSNWFKSWNECEQTVALFSLLKRVHKPQAKFLARCLEHSLRDCVELAPLEGEANDAGFISKLMNEQRTHEQVIQILLTHLPLLRPGNGQAKSKYLEVLPKVLASAVEKSEYLEESRQLLSYSLIHPAFDNEERTSLMSWMEKLGERLVPEASSTENQENNDSQKDVNHNQLWKDDPALPKPNETTGSHNQTNWQSGDGIVAKTDTPSTNSLSPVRRNDDTEQRDNSKPPDEPVIAEYDFTIWLKSLRLHKYKDLFNSMKYDEVLHLTEEKLESKNVTKGARDKILLNIKKLNERFEKLQALEKDIPGGGSLRNGLSELKSMICTPIIRFEPPPESLFSPNDPTPAQAQSMAAGTAPQPPNDIKPGDIPGQFTKVLGKACTQVLISKPDKENITLYMQLLEKCMQHKAFTSQQKKRLFSWKQQINKIYKSLPRSQQMSSQRNAVGSGYPSKRVAGHSLPSFGARLTSPIASPPLPTQPLSMFPPQVVKPSWYVGNYGSNTHPTTHTVQQPLDVSRKTASLDPSLVQRPTAYPRAVEGGGAAASGNQPEHEWSKRLDSLSLSVAEQALPDGDRISTL